MDAYVLQTDDGIDDRYRQYVQDTESFYNLVRAVATANHPVRYAYALQHTTVTTVDLNKQYELMMHMIVVLSDPAGWIDKWFQVFGTYTKHEILNNITPNHIHLMLNEIMNTMQGNVHFDTIVTRAILCGCDVLATADGVPPLLNLYNIAHHQLYETSEYLERVVFRWVEEDMSLDACRLRSTDENLLHIAASFLDFEGLDYMVRTLGMDINATYQNESTNGPSTGFDNLLDVDTVHPATLYDKWFNALGADKNLVFQVNGRSYTQLTKYCGLKDPSVARLFVTDDDVNVHLGSLNPCLVAASSGHHDVVLTLLNAGIEVDSYYDGNDCSTVFYMIQKYHASYNDTFAAMTDLFLNAHLVNRRLQQKIVQAVACYAPTALLKYLIEERRVSVTDLDGRGMDLMQIAIAHLTAESNANTVHSIYKNLNYLLIEVGFKPDILHAVTPRPSDPEVTVSSVDMVLAALFHYMHRVDVNATEDNMLVPQHFDPDMVDEVLNNQLVTDYNYLETIFQENDKDDGQNEEESQQRTARVLAGLEYVYSIYPHLENQLLQVRQKIIMYRIYALVDVNARMYETKANRSHAVMHNVIMKHSGPLYKLAVCMIQMSRQVNPIFQKIFHNKPSLNHILKRGMTLCGLVTPHAVKHTQGNIDKRFQWWCDTSD